jgi:hypothetical protein
MGDTRPMILIHQLNTGDDAIDTHKLLIQVHDVVIETPVDRVERLKISDGKTQPIGAHEKEKKTS